MAVARAAIVPMMNSSTVMSGGSDMAFEHLKLCNNSGLTLQRSADAGTRCHCTGACVSQHELTPFAAHIALFT